MNRRRRPEQLDGGGVEEASPSDQAFKYALIIYAVAEFIAIALVVYYKLTR